MYADVDITDDWVENAIADNEELVMSMLEQLESMEDDGNPEVTSTDFDRIDNLTEIQEDQDEDDSLTRVFGAIVTAFTELETVFPCVHCKKPVISSSRALVVCGHCNTHQRTKNGKETARLYIDTNGQTFLFVQIILKILLMAVIL